MTNDLALLDVPRLTGLCKAFSVSSSDSRSHAALHQSDLPIYMCITSHHPLFVHVTGELSGPGHFPEENFAHSRSQ